MNCPVAPPSQRRSATVVRFRSALAVSLLSTGLLLLAPATVAHAQSRTGQDLAPFFPLQTGDLWTYEAEGGASWARTVTAAGVGDDGLATYRLDESSQDHRLQRWQSEGLVLLSLHFAGGLDIEYETPVLLVPSDLAVGSTHQVEARYRVTELGVPSHSGTQTFEVERLRDRALQTPAGGFENCLVLRIRSRRESESGAVAESTLRQTRAAGVGLVEIQRVPGPSGQEAWTASLTGASVGGRLVP